MGLATHPSYTKKQRVSEGKCRYTPFPADFLIGLNIDIYILVETRLTQRRVTD